MAQVLEAFAARQMEPSEVTPTTSGALSPATEDSAALEAVPALSNRQLRRQRATRTADLKTVVARPDLVELADCTAPDPLLAVHLRCVRGVVPTPAHWSRKRHYLQGPAPDRPQYSLPPGIAATGVADARDATRADENSSVAAQARARMRGKSGRLAVDYRRLHAAFFGSGRQMPPTAVHGDLYYEGKEATARRCRFFPGKLSPELRAALAVGPTDAPPWLQAQQRLGLPPSYPQLRVPGLNAPLPLGASWGSHTGGWGAPPPNFAQACLQRDPYYSAHLAPWGSASLSADAAGVDAALAAADIAHSRAVGGGECAAVEISAIVDDR
jgi:hypothetical protein